MNAVWKLSVPPTSKETVMSDLDQATDRLYELPMSDTSNKAARPAICRLESDLGPLASATAPIDLAGIAKLSRYKIERAKAMDWAMNDMKFLVYDDIGSNFTITTATTKMAC